MTIRCATSSTYVLPGLKLDLDRWRLTDAAGRRVVARSARSDEEVRVDDVRGTLGVFDPANPSTRPLFQLDADTLGAPRSPVDLSAVAAQGPLAFLDALGVFFSTSHGSSSQQRHAELFTAACAAAPDAGVEFVEVEEVLRDTIHPELPRAARFAAVMAPTHPRRFAEVRTAADAATLLFDVPAEFTDVVAAAALVDQPRLAAGLVSDGAAPRWVRRFATQLCSAPLEATV